MSVVHLSRVKYYAIFTKVFWDGKTKIMQLKVESLPCCANNYNATKKSFHQNVYKYHDLVYLNEV
jgi:hypothetical protein